MKTVNNKIRRKFQKKYPIKTVRLKKEKKRDQTFEAMLDEIEFKRKGLEFRFSFHMDSEDTISYMILTARGVKPFLVLEIKSKKSKTFILDVHLKKFKKEMFKGSSVLKPYDFGDLSELGEDDVSDLQDFMERTFMNRIIDRDPIQPVGTHFFTDNMRYFYHMPNR